MFKLAVLASGRGSNLGALIDAVRARSLHARIVGVFSDKAQCGALELARDAGIEAVAISPKAHATRADFDEALFAAVDAREADLVVCAGFMRILSAEVVASRPGRVINIHPSLLPKYPGLHTRQRALDAGDHEHGASVHVVIPALDAGPVIAQTRLAILAADDADSLAGRLLPREHRLLVQVVRWCAEGRLDLSGNPLRFDGAELQVPLAVD